MYNKKIAIIGCGNLGLAIMNGLLSKSDMNPSHITVTRRNVKVLSKLVPDGVQVTSDNVLAIQNSEIIIVALKPYKILDILQELAEHINPEKHIIISLATGISIHQIQDRIPKDVALFRAMPNTAAKVANSMTCICGNSKQEEKKEWVEACFNTIGSTIFIHEDLMDSATVIGACGIAYVLRFIRAMIQGGIEIGFDANTAKEIVTHTVKGAAELLIQGDTHPEFEIDKVTTPKGCTIAGLNEMEHNGFSSALIKGIVTSYDKIEK